MIINNGKIALILPFKNNNEDTIKLIFKYEQNINLNITNNNNDNILLLTIN